MCKETDCDSRAVCKGWCNKHYQRWYKHGDPGCTTNVPTKATLEERLRHYGWSTTPTGCWEWNGSRLKTGYGRVAHQHKVLGAHRVAHEVWIGPIPEGLQVNHHCDNPPCINPEHLYAGTAQENMQDKVNRGRWKGGRKNLDAEVVDIEAEEG